MFQSTHPHGVRQQTLDSFNAECEFQSTHPHGVRPFKHNIGQIKRRFNPRTHTGCDRALKRLKVAFVCFNPRTHTGCDSDYTKTRFFAAWFQSTHPHGVRLCLITPTTNPKSFQSTHPHGVRPLVANNDLNFFEFQSTHPHGVRLRVRDIDFVISGFQSTHPHGVRPHQRSPRQYITMVSIHAPTRGATNKAREDFTAFACFNPRTHTGCDPETKLRPALIGSFQSTHPHGVRPNPSTKTKRPKRFQSTHPHGVRQGGQANETYRKMFQSTHPHGVRHNSLSVQYRMC